MIDEKRRKKNNFEKEFGNDYYAQNYIKVKAKKMTKKDLEKLGGKKNQNVAMANLINDEIKIKISEC